MFTLALITKRRTCTASILRATASRSTSQVHSRQSNRKTPVISTLAMITSTSTRTCTLSWRKLNKSGSSETSNSARCWRQNNNNHVLNKPETGNEGTSGTHGAGDDTNVSIWLRGDDGTSPIALSNSSSSWTVQSPTSISLALRRRHRFWLHSRHLGARADQAYYRAILQCSSTSPHQRTLYSESSRQSWPDTNRGRSQVG